MAQIYFAILTAIGQAKLAAATALGTTLQLTEMAVGDGNGATPIPNRNQIALVHENRRAPLNTLFVDPANASLIVAEQIIPEDVGGWWIRELGLYDAAGDLCAVANCPDTYKPVLASGSGRTQILRMVLIVANAEAVELKIDPSVVLAPRGYVDQVMASHTAAADPHPQYLTSAEGDAKVAEAVAALVAASPSTLDTLAELAAALGNDPNFATAMTNALAAKAPLASPSLTGQPKVPLGTAAAPGLALTGDTDTGLYSPGADQLGLAVGGVGALLVDATGRVIIGGSAVAAAGYTTAGDVTLPAGAGIRALNTCKAWAAVSGAGAILDSFGISAVTRVSAGLYTCTLARGLANSNYAVMGFSAGASGETSHGITEESGFAKTTSTFQVQTGNTETNGRFDGTRFYIFVFGRDA